jgi:membrane protease YdiL (CAAX protease family)
MSEHPPFQSSVSEVEPNVLAPRERRRFPLWSVWDVVALFLFASLAAVVVGSFGSASWKFLLAKFHSMQLLHHPALEAISLLIFQALLDVFIFLFIYFTITLKYGAPFWVSIKWTGRTRKPLLTYLPVGVVLALMALYISALLPSSQKAPIEELLEQPASAFLFAGLGVFIAPLVEELLFRGFIYPVAERGLGRFWAVVITALLFTGLHLGQLWGSWTGIAMILLVGVTLSIVRAGTDSVIPSFIIHLSYNSTLCLLFLGSAFVKGFPH